MTENRVHPPPPMSGVERGKSERGSHEKPIGEKSNTAMQVIPLDQFPQPLLSYGRFQTIQFLWHEQPEMRPELARGLRRICRAINRVVTGKTPR